MAANEIRFKKPRLNVTVEAECEENGGPSGRESVGGNGQTIPYDINNWSEQTLQEIGIVVTYADNIAPLDLLRTFPLQYPLGKDLSQYFLWKHINIIENFLKKDCLFHEFLDAEIHTLSRRVVDALRKRTFYSRKQSLNASEELKFWFQRFEIFGMQFAEMLYSMVLKRDLSTSSQSGEVPELSAYDFQFLFEAFASMFGLNTYSRAEPLMHSSMLQLSQANITGKADILYCWDIAPDEEGSIEELAHVIAVCEVKKQSALTDDDTRVSSASSNILPPHIPMNLLGKHGGELLLHYRQSIKRNVIFGMIIQETKVTFTALKMTEKQFHGILTGKYDTVGPQLTLTKPYDFLRKEDRKLLIRPLLELALMQELNFSKRNVWVST